MKGFSALTVLKRHGLVAPLAMLASAACWGGATVMSRDLLVYFAVPSLLAVQLAASVTALLLLSVPHRPWRYMSPELGRASLIGILEPGLTYSIGLWGLSLTSAGNASVIGSAEPILIIILSWIILKNRPSGKLLLCITLAVLGLYMVSYESALSVSGQGIGGDLLVLMATLFAAVYVVFSSRWVTWFPAAVLALAQQVVGLGCAIIIYAFALASGLLTQNLSDLSWPILLYGAVSGVVQYALAFWFYLIGLKQLSPGVAALWLTLIPIFTVIGAYFWLCEVPTVFMLIGMALIIFAIYIGRGER